MNKEGANCSGFLGDGSHLPDLHETETNTQEGLFSSATVSNTIPKILAEDTPAQIDQQGDAEDAGLVEIDILVPDSHDGYSSQQPAVLCDLNQRYISTISFELFN